MRLKQPYTCSKAVPVPPLVYYHSQNNQQGSGTLDRPFYEDKTSMRREAREGVATIREPLALLAKLGSESVMWRIGQVTLVTWKPNRINRISSICYRACVATHVSSNVIL
jgi:hypothetical protein